MESAPLARRSVSFSPMTFLLVDDAFVASQEALRMHAGWEVQAELQMDGLIPSHKVHLIPPHCFTWYSELHLNKTLQFIGMKLKYVGQVIQRLRSYLRDLQQRSDLAGAIVECRNRRTSRTGIRNSSNCPSPSEDLPSEDLTMSVKSSPPSLLNPTPERVLYDDLGIYGGSILQYQQRCMHAVNAVDSTQPQQQPQKHVETNQSPRTMSAQGPLSMSAVSRVALSVKFFLRLVWSSLRDCGLDPAVFALYRLGKQVFEQRKAVVILLAGTSGTGKSTLASLLADRLQIATIISSDSVREMLREMLLRYRPDLVGQRDFPALFSSTYEAHLALGPETGTGAGAASSPSQVHSQAERVRQGYRAQCALVVPLLRKLICQLLVQKVTAIVEGVHLTTEFIAELMDYANDAEYVRMHSQAPVVPWLPGVVNESADAAATLAATSRGSPPCMDVHGDVRDFQHAPSASCIPVQRRYREERKETGEETYTDSSGDSVGDGEGEDGKEIAAGNPAGASAFDDDDDDAKMETEVGSGDGADNEDGPGHDQHGGFADLAGDEDSEDRSGSSGIDQASPSPGGSRPAGCLTFRPIRSSCRNSYNNHNNSNNYNYNNCNNISSNNRNSTKTGCHVGSAGWGARRAPSGSGSGGASCLVIPFFVHISNRAKHKERLAVRSSSQYFSMDPQLNKYIRHFEHIRVIQKHMAHEAKACWIPQVDNTSMDRSVSSVHAAICRCLKRAVDAEAGMADPVSTPTATMTSLSVTGTRTKASGEAAERSPSGGLWKPITTMPTEKGKVTEEGKEEGKEAAEKGKSGKGEDRRADRRGEGSEGGPFDPFQTNALYREYMLAKRVAWSSKAMHRVIRSKQKQQANLHRNRKDPAMPHQETESDGGASSSEGREREEESECPRLARKGDLRAGVVAASGSQAPPSKSTTTVSRLIVDYLTHIDGRPTPIAAPSRNSQRPQQPQQAQQNQDQE